MKVFKNYLVTGGAGFIGSHLVDRLVKLKKNVKVIDNLSTGQLSNLKFSKGKIKFYKTDVSKDKNKQASELRARLGFGGGSIKSFGGIFNVVLSIVLASGLASKYFLTFVYNCAIMLLLLYNP